MGAPALSRCKFPIKNVDNPAIYVIVYQRVLEFYVIFFTEKIHCSPWTPHFFGSCLMRGVIWELCIFSLVPKLAAFRKTATGFEIKLPWEKHGSTVDGKNPAPVDMLNISLFTGFPTCWVVSRISSINSISCIAGFLLPCPFVRMFTSKSDCGHPK